MTSFFGLSIGTVAVAVACWYGLRKPEINSALPPRFCPDGWNHSGHLESVHKQHASSHHFVVATYNAEWLFDGIDDRNGPSSPEEASKHANDVGRVLHRIRPKPDIVTLVEVEHCGVASSVASTLGNEYKTFALQSQDTSNRQTIALLSRLPTTKLAQSLSREAYPVSGSRCGYTPSKQKSTGVSKHFYTVVTVPGDIGEVLLIAVHLKARPTQPKSCSKREAQARLVARLVQEHGHGRNIIVLGDFNDFDETTPDRSTNVPTSDVISSLTRSIDGPQLFNVAQLMPQKERATWSGPKFPDAMFDYILVSDGLRSRIDGVWVDRNESERVSDHQPLVVSFQT